MSSARPYHHGNLRAALIDSAEDVLAESGAGALSLREVARRVGVSHGAPRRHFADRQALLDALAEEGFGRLGRELDEALAGAVDFHARLAACAHVYVRFATQHSALLELMFASKHNNPELEAALDKAFAAPLQAILRGQAEGEVIDGPPDVVGTVVLAALQGLGAMVSMGWIAGTEAEAAVDQVVERLVYGLRPR